MELFAIGVVIILFMAVLKQFGILEPMSSFEGKGPPEAPLLANRYLRFGAAVIYGMAELTMTHLLSESHFSLPPY